jgi:site-specific DNA recombinase
MYFMPVNAIGYVRCSSQIQITNGDGLDIQKERIRAWCKYQGIALREVIADAGISGATTENRPGFKRAMRAALEGAERSVLVVYALDRLGRSALDVQEVLAVLLDAGVRVVSIKDGIDTASGMGAAMLRLLTNILATFAELERERIAGRLLDGRRSAKAKRRKYTREPPYGLTHGNAQQLDDGRRIVPVVANDSEARAMARIRELHGQGATIRQIASQLAAEGLHPRRGDRWSLSVVHGIATGRRAAPRAKASSRIARARAALMEPDASEQEA